MDRMLEQPGVVHMDKNGSVALGGAVGLLGSAALTDRPVITLKECAPRARSKTAR